MVEKALQLRDLTVAFRTESGSFTAVERISLDVEPGEVVGLMGESGCGKSVCALSIMRLLPPPPLATVSGSVMFRDQNLLSIPENQMRQIRGRKISMIFQEPLSALNPVFTVGEQVAEIYRVHQKSSRKRARQQAVEMLDRVGLSDPHGRARQYPHELSGGMRQRVLIAMALACKPDFLIADEPTTALDVTVQAQILELLAQLQNDLKLGVLFITHDIPLVSRFCNRVLVVYAGQIVEQGPVPDVFENPKHPYTHGLLHCLPENAEPSGGGRPRPAEIKGSLPAYIRRDEGCTFAPRCPRADEKCRKETPELLPSPGDEARCRRCHHPLEN